MAEQGRLKSGVPFRGRRGTGSPNMPGCGVVWVKAKPVSRYRGNAKRSGVMINSRQRRNRLGAVLGVGGAVLALMVGPAGATGPGDTEALRFMPPAGWQSVHQIERGGLMVRHFVPPGQGGDTWTDMITVQVLRTAQPPSLEDLYGRALGSYRADCADAQGGGLQEGETNGYATGFWVLGCPENARTGRGETAFFKAMLGEQAVYMLQRVWRTDPFAAGTAAEIAPDSRQQALAILKEALVCRPGSAAHPCP